ncbi:MAG TPA: aminotransferase class IV [Campylobacter avium]|uniref:aminotransferase class IV n=1 Tax=Campylobacter avium TaxID=522485 RepID=UPI001DD6A567|nr:aminotransferase class IV [Campylobacter avium]HJE65868.1 aminotransferase class IV [Campylobacter avium]
MKKFIRIFHILELKRDFSQGFDKDIVRLNAKLFNGNYGFFDEFVSADKARIQDAGQILRLVLHKDESYFFDTLPFTEPKSKLLLLAKEAVYKDDLSFHKSSYNPLFAKYYKFWKNDECFDVAFCNERGELCEGSRSNIIVQKDSVLYTPSLESGLLNGIYRQFLFKLGVLKEG